MRLIRYSIDIDPTKQKTWFGQYKPLAIEFGSIRHNPPSGLFG